MGDSGFDGIVFADTWQEMRALQYAGRVIPLLQNPVMKLSERDFRICGSALQYLRMRMEDERHFFREELLGSLLTAHILDLYDIHARSRKELQVSEHIASLLRNFIELLYDGEYVRNRDLEFYASRLCITPHYLSEICKKASGNRRAYEFFFRVLFQPVCAEAA